jgi:hypothetical protein
MKWVLLVTQLNNSHPQVLIHAATIDVYVPPYSTVGACVYIMVKWVLMVTQLNNSYPQVLIHAATIDV